MKSISVRNVPDNVYTALQEMAKANHRSLQEQIKYILEREVSMVRSSPLATAANWRKRLKGRRFADTVKMIRQDRKRRLDEISEAEGTQLLSEVLSMPIRYFSHRPLIPAAFDLALELRLTLYDAVYLALASERGATLFSADEVMQRAAKKIHVK